MTTPMPDMAALRAAASQDGANIDARGLEAAYALQGPAGLTKQLNEIGPERAARAAKVLGYDYD